MFITYQSKGQDIERVFVRFTPFRMAPLFPLGVKLPKVRFETSVFNIANVFCRQRSKSRPPSRIFVKQFHHKPDLPGGATNS